MVSAADRLLQANVHRVRPMHGRVNVPLPIHLQDQLIRGRLDQSKDLFSRSCHHVCHVDKHHVITWPQTGSLRRAARVHAFHTGWSSPGERKSPWNLKGRRDLIRFGNLKNEEIINESGCYRRAEGRAYNGWGEVAFERKSIFFIGLVAFPITSGDHLRFFRGNWAK